MTEVAGGWVQPLVASMRPHQWVKNGLLFAAIVFAQKLGDPRRVLTVCVAFALWCLMASAVYLWNDLFDLEEDRHHPEKASRPIASGALPVALARKACAVLTAAALVGAFALDGRFGVVMLVYAFMNVAYTIRLKHVVILDVMTLAAGFVLRAVGGGVVIHVEVSPWLVICTILLALFLGFGKRRHELVLLEGRAAEHRKILDEYSPYFLDQMISVVTASTVVAYCLYTLSPEVASKLHVRHLYLTVPFVLYGIFRYLYLVHQKGQGGNPSKVLLTDPPLITTIALWLLTATIILYR
ncbi:MAG: decaprenyl-phosphate phosphoribosyltransferase [bacterium]